MPNVMPATTPPRKAVPLKKATAKKTVAKAAIAKKPTAKTARNSNFIPDYFKGKIIVHPDFFEPHERLPNWPSGE